MLPPSRGERYAGVVTGRGSGVVVVDDDLVGVIRVGCSVCLRLGNVGIGFGASDHIDICAAIGQGRQQFWVTWDKEPNGEAVPPPFCCLARLPMTRRRQS